MRYLFFVSCFLISHLLISQQNELQYSRVKIDLTQTTAMDIARLGLEADHGMYKKGRYLINDYSNVEIDVLKENNITFTILIEDVQAFYVAQNHEDVDHMHHNHSDEIYNESIQHRDLSDCVFGNANAQEYLTPQNYTYGSMGGYLTYSEALAELDKMVALYPELLSSREAIDTILTHEGRPIYWLRLSDNADVDEDEPEVLYTALHHAREPNSLAQMIYYMWYLLENYESNVEVKYLVDNTEMYFIPIVNPDGYVFNEISNPEGGGLWRKNRYAIDSTVFGVDLNRNYGYEWGFDNEGSSNNPNRDTYRGPEAFSEPETKAVRDFCNNHNFRIALNYHTFGNLLIYPWGFNDQPTEDHDIFTNFANLMTRENNYFAGTGVETVGYVVNGDSDDWMYGDTVSKPAIYSLTPEAGPQFFGFWPPEDQIDAINKSNVYQNLMAAHLLLNYGEAEEIDGVSFLTELEGDIDLVVKKYGLTDGELLLTVSGGDNLIIVNNDEVNFNLNHLEEQSVNVTYKISDDIEVGDELEFVLTLNNGQFVKTDTIRKTYLNGITNVVFEDAFNDVSSWLVSDTWDLTTEDFVSSPTSITDSPNGDYEANLNLEFNLASPIDLSLAQNATLTFNAKWSIEAGFDFAQVLASSDGITYIPLCGKYTTPGSGSQDFENPLYDGIQEEWIAEEMDLSDFVGDLVYIQFRLVSDIYVESDGFYFDDLKIETISETVSNENITASVDLKVTPNPFSELVNVQISTERNFDNMDIKMLNSLGQVVMEKRLMPSSRNLNNLSFDTATMADGLYYIYIEVDNVLADVRKIVKR